MTLREVEEHAKPYARIAGALYLIIIAAGVFAQLFVFERLTVSGDAAATAANIVAHEALFRAGIAADLSTFVLAIAVTAILYALLKRVHRTLALLMLAFNLVQDALGGLNALNSYRPLQLLGGAGYLESFSLPQLQAMAMLSLRAHTAGFAIAMIFFGCSCLALGYLIFASGFWPKTLGVLIAIAGLCYLINNVTFIFAPALAARLFGWMMLPAFVGEFSFALWLTAKGMDVSRWEEASEKRLAR